MLKAIDRRTMQSVIAAAEIYPYATKPFSKKRLQANLQIDRTIAFAAVLLPLADVEPATLLYG